MNLSVVSIDRQLVRVQAEGEVTMADFSADGRDPLETLLGAGWATQKVVLDCSRVTFLDSSAIGWLMTCRREFDRKGGLFLLHSIPPRVRQVLDMLRVGKALPLLPDEGAALAVAAASTKGNPPTKAYPTELDASAPEAAPAARPAAAPKPAASPKSTVAPKPPLTAKPPAARALRSADVAPFDLADSAAPSIASEASDDSQAPATPEAAAPARKPRKPKAA